MGAYAYAVVRCDHREPAGLGLYEWCEASVEEGTTRTEARRAARKLGWTVGVHSGGTRKGGCFDYCPDHKPAGPGSEAVTTDA